MSSCSPALGSRCAQRDDWMCKRHGSERPLVENHLPTALAFGAISRGPARIVRCAALRATSLAVAIRSLGDALSSIVVLCINAFLTLSCAHMTRGADASATFGLACPQTGTTQQKSGHIGVFSISCSCKFLLEERNTDCLRVLPVQVSASLVEFGQLSKTRYGRNLEDWALKSRRPLHNHGPRVAPPSARARALPSTFF